MSIYMASAVLEEK